MEGYEFKWPTSSKEPEELFIDRDEPARYFSEKLIKIDDAVGNKSSKVITYYGEGGIGKSWLLKCRLFDEVKEQETKLKKKYAVVYHNLETSSDIIGILCSFRSQIAVQMPRSAFPVFDAAISRYEMLCGIPVKLNRQKTRLNKTIGTIADLCSALSMIPGVGPFYTALSIFAQAKSVESLNNLLKKVYEFGFTPETKKRIKKALTKHSADSVAEYAAECFAYDLFNNMHEYSVVFLVDTMEKLSHEDRSPNALKVERTLLEYLPVGSCNCLWVFAGRERMYPDINPSDESMNALEIDECEIRDLKKEDAVAYLRDKQEIEDEAVIERIYEITEGTPMFLEMCVNTYRRQGCPTADAFFFDNKRELIKRYVKYLNYSEKLIIRAMSTIIHWTDSDFKEVFSEVFGQFDQFQSAYESVINTSMIEKINDQRFFLHRSVRSAIYRDEEYPEDNRDKIQAAIISLYRRRLEEEDCDEVYYKDRFIELMYHLAGNQIVLSEESAGDMTYIMVHLNDRLKAFGEDSVQDVITALEDICMEAFEKYDENHNYAYVLAAYYEKAGNYARASEIREQFVNILQNAYKYGDDNPLVIENKLYLSLDWCAIGKAQYALPMAEEILKVCTSLPKKQDETIFAKYVCAKAKSCLEQYDKAVTDYEDVRVALQRRSDKKDMQVVILNDLAYAYAKLGNDKVAVGIWKDARELALSIFGKNDPDTLEVFEKQLKFFKEFDKDEEAAVTGLQLADLCKACAAEKSQKAIDFIDDAMAALVEHGMHSEAAECEKELLKILKDLYGEYHPDTLTAMTNLGRLQMFTDEVSEGRENLSNALKLSLEILDEDNPIIYSIMTSLADVNVLLSDFDEAIRIQTKVVEKYKELYGEDNEKTLYEIGILDELIDNSKHK